MDPFDRFVLDRKQDLKRIERHTRGEYEDRDVVNEAWAMAQTLSAPFDIPTGRCGMPSGSTTRQAMTLKREHPIQYKKH